MLPKFIIAGAAKSGTTSLYKYLSQHPDIYMSAMKEINYFALDDPHVLDNWKKYPFLVKNQADYERLFDECAAGQLGGEASPIYLESKLAAKRIKELIPDCKIFIMLRNPIARAYSGYLMHMRYGSNAIANVENINAEHFIVEKQYVKSSFYFENVKRFVQLFGRRNVKIIIFEQFVKNTPEQMVQCCEFLNVDSSFHFSLDHTFNKGKIPKYTLLNSILMSELVRHNFAKKVPPELIKFGKKLWHSNMKEAPAMPDSIREILGSTFVEDVTRLEKLLDQSLSEWNIKT